MNPEQLDRERQALAEIGRAAEMAEAEIAAELGEAPTEKEEAK